MRLQCEMEPGGPEKLGMCQPSTWALSSGTKGGGYNPVPPPSQ